MTSSNIMTSIHDFFAEDYFVHGDDVFWQELYYYLDATPTHSYMKMMYKYPQAPAAQQCDFGPAWPSTEG